MSRDLRDDVRDDREAREIDRVVEISREHYSICRDLLSQHLDLPRGETRERLDGRQRDYLLDENETDDGRVSHRDVEIVTEHYSRGQISGKSRAGFACYRAGGRSARSGGRPFDPRHLTRL